MSNVVKFCGCKACRAGRKAAGNKVMIRKELRKFRRTAKRCIRMGVDAPTKVSIPYTD
jgi:hypothetical protein